MTAVRAVALIVAVGLSLAVDCSSVSAMTLSAPKAIDRGRSLGVLLVTCLAATYCVAVAVDAKGHAAVLHRSMIGVLAWSPTSAPEGLMDIACATRALCVGVNEIPGAPFA